MPLKRIKNVNLALLVVWIFGVLYASLASNKDLPDVQLFPHVDKLFHFVFYFGMIHLSLTYNMLCNVSSLIKGLTILLILSLGIVIEYLQEYLNKGRSFSVEDMFANTLGLLFGIILFYILEDVYKRIIKQIERVNSNKTINEI